MRGIQYERYQHFFDHIYGFDHFEYLKAELWFVDQELPKAYESFLF